MESVVLNLLPASAKPDDLVGPRQLALRFYALGLGGAAIVMAGLLIMADYGVGSPVALTALVAVALLAERQSISLTPTIAVSVASLTFIFAGIVFGPLAAMVVGAAGLLVDFGRPHVRWVIWTASRSIVAGTSALAAVALGAPAIGSFGILLGAVVAASVVEAVLDLGLGSITAALRGTGKFRELTRDLGPLLIASVPLHAPVIAVIAYAYTEISPWSAVLFVLPAFAAQRLFLLYRQQRQTAEELISANDRLQRANLSFATALVATLEARDRYTAGHSTAVAMYAKHIAARMGLSAEEQDLAHVCGLVHDIGKVGLPAGLLEKQGPLTLEERRRMQKHSTIGERILAKVEDYAEISKIVRHHHERVDAEGYPDRLTSTEIPLISRIIAVADAYDAMTSDRPYRDAMPSRVARLRLAQAVESQFDTAVVAAFEAILASATEDYRRGRAIEPGAAASHTLAAAPAAL